MRWSCALLLPFAVTIGAAAQSNPTVISDSFVETVLYSTISFSNSPDTVAYLGVSGELPADVAAGLETSSAITSLPTQTFVQSALANSVLVDDLTFLEDENENILLPNVIQVSDSSNVYLGLNPNDSDLPDIIPVLFPGYSGTIESVATDGTVSISTGAYVASTNTLYDGTVTFDIYSETDLATPDTVATPEPSPLLMTATGLSLVLAAAFRLSALPALSS